MPESWAGITPELQQCRAYLTLRGRLLGRALLELGWLRLFLASVKSLVQRLNDELAIVLNLTTNTAHTLTERIVT